MSVVDGPNRVPVWSSARAERVPPPDGAVPLSHPTSSGLNRTTPPAGGRQDAASTAATSSEVSDFARSVHGQDSAQQRLQRGVELVVDLVEGCDHVGVTLAEGRRLLTPAASDDLVRRGDDLQQELGEGPCLDSIRLEHTVISHDLAGEERWPRWATGRAPSSGWRRCCRCCCSPTATRGGR